MWVLPGYDGGMFDTCGSRLNFSVVAGVEETFLVSFCVGGEGVDVSGACFEGAVYAVHGGCRGEVVGVLVGEHDVQLHRVLLRVPVLACGHYDWELRAVDSAGAVCRLLYGTLTALCAGDVAGLVEGAEEVELRELCVQLAAGAARPLQVRWQACSAPAGLAAAAAEAALRAEAAAAEAAAVSAEVRGRAEGLAAWIAVFDTKVQQVLVLNPTTKTIWVGGKDTGEKYCGEDGKSPMIDGEGYWNSWNGTQWVCEYVKAAGEDGHSPYINSLGNWATWNPYTGAYFDTGTCLRVVTVWTVRRCGGIWWRATGIFRRRVRRVTAGISIMCRKTMLLRRVGLSCRAVRVRRGLTC